VVDRKVVVGAFSKPGWVFMQNAFRDPTRFFSGERWVMGDQGTTGLDAAAIDQLRKRYQNDYIQQWREFIRNGSVLRYTSLNDANNKLRLLSGPQSPLLQLFSLVSKNTSVGVPDVDNMFRASQALVPPPGDALAGAANQPYMSGLVGLQNAIDPFASQPPNDTAVAQITPQEQAAKAKVSEVALTFGNDAELGAVRQLLEAPITNVDPVLKRAGRGAEWRRQVFLRTVSGADA
jgi:type VI secretion system protein ImpL